MDCRNAAKVLKQKCLMSKFLFAIKNRIGVSKVSGTVKGSVMAGIKIIGWIFKYTLNKIPYKGQNNNMLQLSYIIVIYIQIFLLLFFYSLAHFNLLLNYLKVKK
jgi:hypothetical protein